MHPDWLIARAAGHDLLTVDGLAVYARYPKAQMGPLALALAQLPRDLYLVAGAASLGVVFYLLAEGTGWPRDLRVRLTAVVAGFLAVGPWGQLAGKGHADDALVIIGTVWLVVALGRRRSGQAVAGFAIALLGKPTGVALAPALVLDSMSAATGAAVVTAAIWLPFFLRDPHALLSAGRGIMPVGRDSLPDYLGYSAGQRIPFWVRPVQLFGGVAATAYGQWRDRLPEMVIAAFTVRALVETNPAPAYSIPLVLLALIPDLRLGYPVFTILAGAGFYLSQPVLDGDSGIPRITALVLLLAATVFSAVFTNRRTAAVAVPAPARPAGELRT